MSQEVLDGAGLEWGESRTGEWGYGREVGVTGKSKWNPVTVDEEGVFQSPVLTRGVRKSET